MKRLLTLTILLLLSLSAVVALAHESQPGNLQIQQLDSERYQLTWRAPIYYGKEHPAVLNLPAPWKNLKEPVRFRLADSVVEKRLIKVGPDGINGHRIDFSGLQNTVTDVFVHLTRVDGTSFTTVVRPSSPWVELRGERNWVAAAQEYLGLGFHHILLGADHLLFVLGLLLIIRERRTLIKTVTAFTIAHSITLGLATLDILRIPMPPLEATIALSILFLGPEIVRSWRNQTSLTIRHPWVVAFLFGLLHGFGFASGLTTTGLPKLEILQALVWFNLGVEFCQLVFVALVILLLRSIRFLDFQLPTGVTRAPGYLVGCCGAFWTIERAWLLFSF